MIAIIENLRAVNNYANILSMLYENERNRAKLLLCFRQDLKDNIFFPGI